MLGRDLLCIFLDRDFKIKYFNYETLGIKYTKEKFHMLQSS